MPLANVAAGYAIYKGVKGLMSRIKGSNPKKKKTKEGPPVSIGHGMRSMKKIYDKYKVLED